MKVLKFGGTSVGTVESLTNVKKIVEAIPEPAVVVVSALGGLTDKLIATAGKASHDDPSYRDDMQAISFRHFNIISRVIDEGKRDEALRLVGGLLNDLSRLFDGISLIRHLPQQTLDMVVSFGERISSIIVAFMIDGGKRFDSLDFIKTEEWFGKNIADQKLTTSLIKEKFSVPFDKAIVPGFISTDRKTGNITNLGRGGSDFTAALIAAALDADLLEIWTDVDGFMTADPRIIPEAEVVPRMSFVESMELCTFGAKVIYPPTIYPVFHKNIPIKILNTFNPTAPGTLVSDSRMDSGFSIKGVSVLRSTPLFSIGSYSSVSNPESRALNALARQGVKIYPMTVSANAALNFAVAADDEEKARAILLSEFAPEIPSHPLLAPSIKGGLSTVAVVGENLKSQPRLGARIRNSLMRGGIAVEAFSDGMSDSTLTLLVDSQRANDALRIVHSLVV
ncbi:MAG: aspartate kinase [Muribaculaceae bacterium]|nr:aspartate kinase [Muribaculaceae bacterium]